MRGLLQPPHLDHEPAVVDAGMAFHERGRRRWHFRWPVSEPRRRTHPAHRSAASTLSAESTSSRRSGHATSMGTWCQIAIGFSAPFQQLRCRHKRRRRNDHRSPSRGLATLRESGEERGRTSPLAQGERACRCRRCGRRRTSPTRAGRTRFHSAKAGRDAVVLGFFLGSSSGHARPDDIGHMAPASHAVKGCDGSAKFDAAGHGSRRGPSCAVASIYLCLMACLSPARRCLSTCLHGASQWCFRR